MPGSFEELNAKINRLKREGGVGYTSPGRVYTFNGDSTGKVTATVSQYPYAKISNDTPDLNGIVKGFGFFAGRDIEVTKDDLTISSHGTAQVAYSARMQANVIYSVPAATDEFPEPGLYVIAYGANYIANVEFAETIHPISDKYLPEGFGGGGPVVIDLDTYGAITETIVQLFDAGGGSQKDIEVGNLFADLKEDRPTLAKFTYTMYGFVTMPVTLQSVTIVRMGDEVSQFAASCVMDTPNGIVNATTIIFPEGTVRMVINPISQV